MDVVMDETTTGSETGQPKVAANNPETGKTVNNPETGKTVNNPETGKAVTSTPETGEPVVASIPEAGKAVISTPETDEPVVASIPEAGKAVISTPETTELAASIPETGLPVASNSGNDENQKKENGEDSLVKKGECDMEVDEMVDQFTKTANTDCKVEEKNDVQEDRKNLSTSENQDPKEIVVKTEQVEKEDSKASTEPLTAPISGKNQIIKTEVKTEIKNELEGGDGDAYMVLEEADGDDENDISEEELTENQQLRKANLELSERLALLEEFIEVEFSDKFGKFVKKREHLVNVMGLGQTDSDIKSTGKRSSKSLELVGLLKIVNDQARKNYSNRSPRKFNPRETSVQASASTSNSKDSKMQQNVPKPNASKVEANAKKEEPASDPKPKRCHRCRATGHLVRECPVPIDSLDRRVILRKEKKRAATKEKRRRDRVEAIQHPQIKAMRDRRRRIGRALTRERQKLK